MRDGEPTGGEPPPHAPHAPTQPVRREPAGQGPDPPGDGRRARPPDQGQARGRPPAFRRARRRRSPPSLGTALPSSRAVRRLFGPFFIAAGLLHFRIPRVYASIVP